MLESVHLAQTGTRWIPQEMQWQLRGAEEKAKKTRIWSRSGFIFLFSQPARQQRHAIIIIINFITLSRASALPAFLLLLLLLLLLPADRDSLDNKAMPCHR